MGGGEAPDAPLLFLKPPTAVIGPGDAIRLPVDSDEVHFEGELAVVIGALGAREVPRERALDTLLGYTIGNDVTARDQQRHDGQWTRAKGHDSFCPLGPWIETVLDPSDLALRTELDGAGQAGLADLAAAARRGHAGLVRLARHDAAARRHDPHRHAVRRRADDRRADRVGDRSRASAR